MLVSYRLDTLDACAVLLRAVTSRFPCSQVWPFTLNETHTRVNRGCCNGWSRDLEPISTSTATRTVLRKTDLKLTCVTCVSFELITMHCQSRGSLPRLVLLSSSFSFIFNIYCCCLMAISKQLLAACTGCIAFESKQQFSAIMWLSQMSSLYFISACPQLWCPYSGSLGRITKHYTG